MVRVDVDPALFRWAIKRAGLTAENVMRRFPQLPRWERAERKPTLKQLEEFSNATRTAIGYFFLREPPAIEVPIPDFRTIADREIAASSPDLLDTIYICQERQDWYRDYARAQGEKPLAFVGSAAAGTDVVELAAAMRETLDFDVSRRCELRTWSEALREFVDNLDNLGVLVSVSGVVGNNTHRKLDPTEFRGFTLSDRYAPLIFVNGADSKSAQMFTLAHETAHLWRGESGVSESDRTAHVSNHEESWCNDVAAEFLVPKRLFKLELGGRKYDRGDLAPLARRFKVSQLVVLRRYRDVKKLSDSAYWEEYNAELKRLQSLRRATSGGNFYATEGARVGKRFARAVVSSTLEGGTLYRDALRMLNISKMDTFRDFAHSIGAL